MSTATDSGLEPLLGSRTIGPFYACIDLRDYLGDKFAAYSLICATAVDGSGITNEFGHCDPNCLSVHFPEESCIAVGGPGIGKACVFPFTFEGVKYDKCQYYLDGQLTCATEVDDNGTTIEYGSCNPHNPHCPIAG